MSGVSDTLIVTFDSSLEDEAGICVSRVVKGKTVVLKMELGEQADILYHLLTEQTAKAEIKPEQKWVLCTAHMPEEGCECWITPKTTNKVYRGAFTQFYGISHNIGFICDDGFMWWNTAKAWMYCEKPEPYKGGNDERD